MKHPLLIAFFLTLFAFLALSATAQEKATVLALPDSLVGKLKENRGTDLNRVKALDDAIMFYFDEHEISDAAGYINELNEIANDLHDNFWIAKSQYYLALCDYEKYDNGAFFKHANEALRIAETLRESKDTQLLLARIQLAKSAAFFDNNLLPECQESIEKGLRIAEKNGFNELKHSFLANFGALLVRLEKYEEAIIVFKKILTEKFELGPLNNIASSYGKLKQFDSTFYYSDSVIRYATSLDNLNDYDMYRLISAYQIKAASQIELKMWESAIQSLDESETYLSQFGDKSLLSSALFYRADALRGLGQNELALEIVDDAIELARSSSMIDIEWFSVKLKSEILENMKAYEQEVENLRYLNILTDTINNRENVEKVQLQQFQQDFDGMKQQYESEQALLRMRQKFIIIIAIILFVFSIVFVIMVWKNRKKKETMLKLELDYRNREITSKALNQNQGNETLNEVIQDLTHFLNNPKGNENVLPSAIRKLKGLVDDGSKSEFDYYFVEVHPDFYTNLKKDFPDLTPNELRLCAFAKLNLPLKKIAEINNVSIDSVKSSRKRLRKSLGIDDPKIDLAEFLSKY